MKLFSSRHLWFDHEVRSHRREYICSFCSSDSSPFDSATALKQHIEASHAGLFSASQISTIVDQGQIPPRNIPISSCPLCKETSILQDDVRMDFNDRKTRLEAHTESNDPRKFRRHLGRHMEQLALFALPKHVTIKEEEAESNEAAADRNSDSGFITSKTSTSRTSSKHGQPGVPSTQQKIIQPISLQAALVETRPSYGKEGLYAGLVLAGYIILENALSFYVEDSPQAFLWYAQKIGPERESYVDWLKMVLETQLDETAAKYALENPRDQIWGEKNIQGLLSGALTDINNLNRYWSTMSRLGVSLVTGWRLLELDKEGLVKHPRTANMTI